MPVLYDRLDAVVFAFRNSDYWDILWRAATVLVVYNIGLIVHRLFLSPLAKFPGPKLLAATPWYETLVDIWNHDFPERLRKIHEQYGPIVRVSPWELHINDAGFIDTVFATAAKHRTDIIAPQGLGMDDSVGSTAQHDVHQMRRKPLDKFLSRQNVVRIQSMIHDEIRVLDRKVAVAKGSGSALRLDHAFMAFTGDIVGQLACGESPRLLDGPGFTPEWLSQYAPVGIIRAIIPKSTGFRILKLLGDERISRIHVEVQREKQTHTEEGSSMFHHLLRSDIPETEKHPIRLSAEATSFLGAGTFPTATTLTLITYYILAQPCIETRLRKELAAVTSEFDYQVPSWTEIEQVEYVGACIKEGLRIMRLFRRKSRISIDRELQFNEWTIPKNARHWALHSKTHANSVFPEPSKFKPERWLSENLHPAMDRNLNPFLKGSRNCIGMHVAWAQMYLILATLFRPNKSYRLSLGDSDESDIVPIIDEEFGAAKHGARGLRTMVI
ncbi:hypothetical protein TruAng_011751 [Truncatella angustata]|nr:hypothetical protein TruAng_011751 [Truncatella angustata]